jgi:hypothetical protein
MRLLVQVGWLSLAAAAWAGCGCPGSATPLHPPPGDDDDDSPPLSTHPGPPAGHSGGTIEYPYGPAKLRMWAQFSVVGGVVVPSSTDGTTTYASTLVLNLVTWDWDPNEPSSGAYCSIVAPLATASLGVLDAASVIGPAAEVGPAPVVETDCHHVFSLPVGFDPTTLVTAFPDWSVGVAAALTPDMQQTIDQFAPEHRDLLLGAHWHVPILKEPEWETGFAVGTEWDGGTTFGADLVRGDVSGRAALPDGIYYSDALLILDATGMLY